MRRFAYAAMIAAFVVACSDSSPTRTADITLRAGLANSRVPAIDNLIVQLFPRGLETSSGKRWDHIDSELGTWDPATNSWTGVDAAAGRQHTFDLIKFIRLKTNDIEPPSGQTQEEAANALIAAMLAYAFSGPTATPSTADLVFAFVPAGQAATIVTPSQHAGVSLEAGSTNEDRIIVISQNVSLQEQRCEGPLNYSGCQYRLFYQFESEPHLKLNIPARFAVCTVLDDENAPTEAEHGRMRLAHDLPADPANYTPGATQVEGIEILQLASTQSLNIIDCDAPAEITEGGIRGFGKRMLYALGEIGSKIFSPKSLYAYDSGPEHESVFFSNFNAVDPVRVTGGVLYGVNSGDDGLSVLDPATGVSTFVARLNPDVNTFTTPVGMATDPSTGVIYVWNNTGPGPALLTVNACTGQATQVNAEPQTGLATGTLALSQATGQLYGLRGSLYSVSKTTGVSTLIGSLGGPDIFGADFDPATNVLYALSSGGPSTAATLYTVNTSTGATTAVAALSQSVGIIGSIVFTPSGSLLGSAFGGTQGDILFDIDKSNGAVSNIRNVTGTGGLPQGMGFAPACSGG